MIVEVLKSELSEAYSVGYNAKLGLDKVSLPAAQLENQWDGLEKARLELKEKRETILRLT